MAWGCFFANRKVAEKIHFESEMWLDRIGCSTFEDRVWFYKLMINGFKTCVVSDAAYIHNDGKTSTRPLRYEPIYASAFNQYVFWHRYIYSLRRGIPKFISWLAVNFCIFTNKVYRFRQKEKREVVTRGFNDAKAFVKSSKYANLPPVIISENPDMEQQLNNSEKQSRAI